MFLVAIWAVIGFLVLGFMGLGIFNYLSTGNPCKLDPGAKGSAILVFVISGFFGAYGALILKLT
jgi:hypothetical protein